MRLALIRFARFGLFAVVAYLAAGVLAGTAGALLGGGTWTYAAILALLLLAATRLALRLDGAPLAALGLTPGARRASEFCLGWLVAASLFASVAVARAVLVGATWQFWGTGGFQAALLGLPVALASVLAEELVFRGYGFRQLVAVCGARPALILSAAAFGLYHLALAGFAPWGMGAVLVFGLPALGGLLFAAAALRTRGLALPLGLHLGGNWVQASVLGLGVAPGAQTPALWTAALTPAQAHTLVAPDALPHLPYLIALVAAAWLVARWPAAHSHRPLPELAA